MGWGRIVAAFGAAGIGLFVVASPAHAAADVEAQDNVFDPEVLRFPPGATVTWENAGDNQHTVTADDGLFDSGTLNPGDSFTFTTDAEGALPYYCRFHGAPGGEGMAGTLLVEESASASTTSADTTPKERGAGDGRLPRTGPEGISIAGLYAIGVATLMIGAVIGYRRVLWSVACGLLGLPAAPARTTTPEVELDLGVGRVLAGMRRRLSSSIDGAQDIVPPRRPGARARLRRALHSRSRMR